MYYDIVCQHEQIRGRRLGDWDAKAAQNASGMISMWPCLGTRSRIVLVLESWIFMSLKPTQTRWIMTRQKNLNEWAKSQNRFWRSLKQLFPIISWFLIAEYASFWTKGRNQIRRRWLSNTDIFSQIKQSHNCYMLFLSQMFLLLGVSYLDYIKHMSLSLGKRAQPGCFHWKPS